MYLDCSGWFGTRIPRSTMVRYGPRVCDSRIGAAQQWSPSRRLPWPPSTPWRSREPRHRMEQPLPTQSYSHTLKWQQHIYIYTHVYITYIYICVCNIYIYAILHYYCYIIILLIYPSSDTSTRQSSCSAVRPAKRISWRAQSGLWRLLTSISANVSVIEKWISWW